jgi:hypothetical protein
MPVPAAEAGGLAELTRRVHDRLGTPTNSAVAATRYLTVDGLLEQLGVKR